MSQDQEVTTPLSTSTFEGELNDAVGVELFGHCKALSDSVVHLAFTQHVHQFHADQGLLRRLKGLEPEHRPSHPLHASMVLLHHIIKILDLD